MNELNPVHYSVILQDLETWLNEGQFTRRQLALLERTIATLRDDLARMAQMQSDNEALTAKLKENRLVPPPELCTPKRDAEGRIDYDSLVSLAMSHGEEAARWALECIPLPKAPEMFRVHKDFWEFMCATLGVYDTTYPTGARIGERWCSTQHGPRARPFIWEYKVDNSTKGFLVAIATPVELYED